MGRKSIADKMIAVKHGGAGHVGVTKAAKVPAKMAPAKAAKVPPAKAATVAATVTATVHGGRTQSRTGRDHRRGGQCYRYFPHHDVHSTSCEMHPSRYEGRQLPSFGLAVLSFGYVALPSECQCERRFRAPDVDRKGTAQHRHGNRNNQITYASVSD